MNFCKKALIFLIVLSAFSHRAVAQRVIKGGGDIVERSVLDLTLVGVIGLSGGVIGLSTLSFVDSPAKNLNHITVGVALGIIFAVAWIGYSQAVSTYEEVAFQKKDLNRPLLALRPFPHPSFLVGWNWHF